MKKNFWSGFIIGIRPPTLLLAFSGSFLAVSFANSHLEFQNQTLEFWPVFLIFSTSILLQIISNLANDLGDGLKGTDNANRLGPIRALQGGFLTAQQIRNLLIFFIVLGLLSGFCLIWFAFESISGEFLLFSVIGIVSILSALKYTLGKNPFGYRGLGDLFVFIFFGPVLVCGGYYLLTKNLQFSIVCAGVSLGLLSAGVLNINNIRDIENDKNSGKKTLAVYLGLKGAKYWQYSLFTLSISFFCMSLAAGELFKLIYLAPIVLIPFLLVLSTQIKNNKNPVEFNKILKKLVLFIFIFSLVWGLSLQ